ncbi:hypothetical protein KCP74_22505 [Salmonella enterica subsp. enterica]|nr:hypothetical protein KCP74_22505 [Salmonella enterica subsp. enterica]
MAPRFVTHFALRVSSKPQYRLTGDETRPPAAQRVVNGLFRCYSRERDYRRPAMPDAVPATTPAQGGKRHSRRRAVQIPDINRSTHRVNRHTTGPPCCSVPVKTSASWGIASISAKQIK